MEGWLTVLDPVYDLLMCHNVKLKANPKEDVVDTEMVWTASRLLCLDLWNV